MRTQLPVIVGFGGYNAAGRSSGHRSYQRMVFDSLSADVQGEVIAALGGLMGMPPEEKEAILAGTLVRKLDAQFIDTQAVPFALNVELGDARKGGLQFELSARQLPKNLPEGWEAFPLDDEGRRFRINIASPVQARLPAGMELPVKAAGQLPTGFDPGSYYRSTHHPRGLQMSVMGASDAINALGIDWAWLNTVVGPDEMSVYSSSVMCQLDHTGIGGMMNARLLGQRASSKQLSLGFTSMPADFTNAYVLGSLGATGAVTGACATFLYNLRWAVEDIRSGRRKLAVVGCSEAPILPEVIDGFSAMSALATDEDLCKLDGVSLPDYRRASRPFGDNCGFTIAESTQYVVLMSDDLAMATGAEIYGAVPGVYVNADGFKKSISAPGAGNYLTMAKAVGLAKTLLGDEAVRRGSFVQAHGSSTPQNRVTESRILDRVAAAFGIPHWPVAAVKSYLGHSLGPASGDQLACTLGVFSHGILPGIKTIDRVAEDVLGARLSITNKDTQIDASASRVAFLNSKGFGGNNATATILSPKAIEGYLGHHYSRADREGYAKKRESVLSKRDRYLSDADAGKLNPRYFFGQSMIDESDIALSAEQITFPGYELPVSLKVTEGLEGF